MRNFGELILVWDSLDAESVETLNRLKRPSKIAYNRFLLRRWISCAFSWLKRHRPKINAVVDVPKDLNHLTIGELLLLNTSQDTQLPFKLLLKLNTQQIESLSIAESVGFLNFIKTELERINGLFAGARTEPTTEERLAGCGEVGKSVGAFGMIDYVVRRIGCTYEEAERQPWPRVLAMMRLDRDAELYRRALQDIYTKKR